MQAVQYEVREQDDCRYEVVIRQAGADDIRISNFATKAGAEAWATEHRRQNALDDSRGEPSV